MPGALTLYYSALDAKQIVTLRQISDLSIVLAVNFRKFLKNRNVKVSDTEQKLPRKFSKTK